LLKGRKGMGIPVVCDVAEDRLKMKLEVEKLHEPIRRKLKRALEVARGCRARITLTDNANVPPNSGIKVLEAKVGGFQCGDGASMCVQLEDVTFVNSSYWTTDRSFMTCTDNIESVELI
jgi:hypothetical protein